MLISEHAVILEKLEEMEEVIEKLPKVDHNEYTLFFEFVREYVDQYHHNKEEDYYFKWIVKRNPALEFGPIACMLKEHNQGREYIQNAANALEINDTTALKNNINGFIDLLRSHIEKENTVLYKMADDIDRQTQDGDSQLLAAFQEINKNLEKTPLKFGIYAKEIKEVNDGCCGSCT